MTAIAMLSRRGRRLGARGLVLSLPPVVAACSSAPVPTPETHPFDVVTLDPAEASAAISAYRRAHGLSAVQIDPTLQRVAAAQAQAMAGANRLSHEIAGSLSRRLDAARLPNVTAVENVSAGYASFDDALGGWERSPAHDANLRDPPMRRMGIAAARAPDTRYKTFWALVMTD